MEYSRLREITAIHPKDQHHDLRKQIIGLRGQFIAPVKPTHKKWTRPSYDNGVVGWSYGLFALEFPVTLNMTNPAWRGRLLQERTQIRFYAVKTRLVKNGKQV